GALDYAKPLENWKLPDCFDLLRRRLEAEFEKQGTRQFVKVLRLLEHATLAELTGAVEHALSLGMHGADAVRLILQGRQEKPVELFCLDGRPHLKGVHLPPPNLEAYRSLRLGA
ncbi:MAG TPA: IS21 family transposase, partial [Candidatus Methylomirabilis sp.]|nr:IS21 family transposase [Candidatus Methylomirabilis sp.]